MNLTREKWERVVGICAEQNNGRVPMLAGTADLSTAGTIEKSKFAESLGYDGFLIISHWYQVHTMRELEAYFQVVRDATSKSMTLLSGPDLRRINRHISKLPKKNNTHKRIIKYREN